MEFNQALTHALVNCLNKTPLHRAHLADAIGVQLDEIDKILDTESSHLFTMSQFYTICNTLRVQSSDVMRAAELEMIKNRRISVK